MELNKLGAFLNRKNITALVGAPLFLTPLGC